MSASARPASLRSFAAGRSAGVGVLIALERQVEAAWTYCQARCGPADSWPKGSPGDGLAALRSSAVRLDRWVADVASWFEAADTGTWAGLTPALMARVMEPLKATWRHWPAPVVVGYDALSAPRRGGFGVAGYGDACQLGHTAAVSILGPDGLTYPVIVPGAAGTPQESPDWIPPRLPDVSMGTIDDSGRTWTTTLYSQAVVQGHHSWAYRAAGAVAATAGWKPVAGASVSSSEVGQVLRIEPTGQPHLLPGVASHPTPAVPPTVDDGQDATRTRGWRATAATVAAVDLAMAAVGGWRVASNEGSGFVQAQYQHDSAGHRRVLVRAYEVRVANGALEVTGAYWNGRGWAPLGTPTRRPVPVMTAG